MLISCNGTDRLEHGSLTDFLTRAHRKISRRYRVYGPLFIYFGTTDATEIRLPRHCYMNFARLLALWTVHFLSHMFPSSHQSDYHP